jgi:sugar/nucleoside kinase (ribokinase family)
MADVVCLGILVVDVIARPVEAFPERGELMLVEAISPHIGGCAANTGIGLQKLGVETSVLGKVGRDGFGALVCDVLHEHGVDARGVSRDNDAPTSATTVFVARDGERSFLHSIGANAAFGEDDTDWNLLRGARLLHIAGHFLMPSFDGAACSRVLEHAKSLGLLTSLDTAGSPTAQWPELLRPCLKHLDYFVPSFQEALHCVPSHIEKTPPAVARYFSDEGVGVVALKMGEAGSFIRHKNNEWQLPSFLVNAIDATGAGDAFAAGFLAGIINGLDVEEAGKLGNAVGACCVTGVGTIAGIRSLEDTLAFMREQNQSSTRLKLNQPRA